MTPTKAQDNHQGKLMTGAEIFVRCLVEEGVDTLLGIRVVSSSVSTMCFMILLTSNTFSRGTNKERHMPRKGTQKQPADLALCLLHPVPVRQMQ
jgi:hypothetical protein